MDFHRYIVIFPFFHPQPLPQYERLLSYIILHSLSPTYRTWALCVYSLFIYIYVCVCVCEYTCFANVIVVYIKYIYPPPQKFADRPWRLRFSFCQYITCIILDTYNSIKLKNSMIIMVYKYNTST